MESPGFNPSANKSTFVYLVVFDLWYGGVYENYCKVFADQEQAEAYGAMIGQDSGLDHIVIKKWVQ